MSACVAAFCCASVSTPRPVTWNAKSDSCGGASITMPGMRATCSAAHTANSRFSATAARYFAAPKIFTVSQTRSPGNPRESSGPYCAGS